MNIHKNCKIELTASKDRTRIAINEPYLHIEDGKGTLVATDGRRCVVIPVEVGEHDVAGFVSGEALKAARKQAVSDIATVQLNGNAQLPNGATLPREGEAQKDANFPNWKQVVPKEDYPHRICFNAKFLYECAQAMGSENIVFAFSDEKSPIVLTTTSHSSVPGAKAILMPVLLS